MTLVIGTDEAGYGPNLGPLVVVATSWRVAAAAAAAESAVAAAAAGAVHADGRPRWADSKLVFRGGAGFAALERGALGGLSLAAGAVPAGWPALTAMLGVEDLPPTAEDAALAGLSLPCESTAEDLAASNDRVLQRLAAEGVALEAVRARIVQPSEFNLLLDQGLNKSDILSRATLELAAGLARREAEPRPDATLVWCDRHGGRRRYAGLVARHFGATLVHTVEEAAGRSAYEIPATACRVEFTVGGEDRAPVALASMTAKYVRELAMRAFNGFWTARCPGLAPTAGYPVDAARWRREAAASVARERVGWDAVWRRA